ncbi:hypothetical protein LOD99_13472 [Oopsacas minuta]|uniref:YTH domain-containing protein n=1 Tax=Oopsacas minuta TaxID=111878 RepID=A0AAV7KNN4_9METZ|nr:hypothetical protein LOD99_13472 [Oopsacas minuta]
MAENIQVSYFIAKCDNFESLIKCQESKIWACPRHEKSEKQPRDILLTAFNTSQVIIMFSVNASKGWQGYARLMTPPAETAVKKNNSMWYTFEVEWVVTFTSRFRNGLSFSMTEDIMIHEKENLKSLNKARNWETVNDAIGKNLCNLLDAQYKLSKENEQKVEARKMGYENPIFFKLSETDSTISSSALWERLTTHVKDYGRIMLACPFGSHRYNLHGENSDLDMFVVYIGDTEKCLSFHPPPLTIKNRTSEQPDFTLYELYRYCELLVTGDPRVVESLFLHNNSIHYAIDEYYQFVELRKNVLSRDVVRKYLSDACGNHGLKKLLQWEKQDNPPNKDKLYKVLYIVMRLLFHARQIALGEEIRVFFEEKSEEREFLLSIRRHECTYQVVKDRIELVRGEIDVLLKSDNCELKNSAYVNPIEQLMLSIRRKIC